MLTSRDERQCPRRLQTVTYETFVADQDQRESFLAAIEQLAPRLGQQHRFFVAGEEREGDGWEDEYSPADNRLLIGSFAAGTMIDVDDAIYDARAAQPDWAATPWRERVEIVSRISGLVAARRYELAAILAYEIGKPVLEALGEVDELIALVDCYCADMVKHDGFEISMSELGDERSLSVMRPHGLWVVIGPFNFPMALGLGPIAAAVIAGNACVFKPSPHGYWSGLTVHELFRDAGIPPGVLNTVTVPNNRLSDGLFARDDVDGSLSPALMRPVCGFTLVSSAPTHARASARWAARTPRS